MFEVEAKKTRDVDPEFAIDEEKINVAIHVVNSVKGGCGKSTFSLWLSEYWRSKGELVYVIDLDIDGTSWENEYKDCFVNDDDCIYINDVAINCSSAKYLNPWRTIDSKKLFAYDNVEMSGNKTIKREEFKIKACIADPKKRMRKIDYEVDLFEQALTCLIEDVYKRAEKGKRVHIVFDMPPGYDKKSEFFLKHYLLTNKFFLYADDKCKYNIKLYMLSSLIVSSFKASIEYAETLCNKPFDFGDIYDELKGDGRIDIVLVFNDNTNVLRFTSEGEVLLAGIKKEYDAVLKRFNHFIIKFTEKIPYLKENILSKYGKHLNEQFRFPHTMIDKNDIIQL